MGRIVGSGNREAGGGAVIRPPVLTTCLWEGQDQSQGGVPAGAGGDTEVIEHGLRLARGSDADRARFHASYVSVTTDPGVERVEVVTELRRVVLLAEAHASRGDRPRGDDADDVRAVADALRPYRHRLQVVVQLRFHPQSGYLSVPALDLRLGGGPSMQPALEMRAEPVYAFSSSSAEPSDVRRVIVGATVEASFDALAAGRGIQTLVIHVNHVYLLLATLDLTRMP
jgi:hypothetical protein